MKKSLIKKEEKIGLAQFSPSGNKIITMSDCVIHVWDMQKECLQSSFKLIEKIGHITFNKDETKIVGTKHHNKYLFYGDLQTKKSNFSNIGHTVTSSHNISDDGINAIIESWNEKILVNTQSGAVEKVLYEEGGNRMNAYFIKDSSIVHVIHNGDLNHYEDTDCVYYKAILPIDTHLPLYNNQANRLIYSHNQEPKIIIINYDTKEEKILSYTPRINIVMRYVHFCDNGKKLFFTYLKDSRRRNDSPQNSDGVYYIDIYDLDNCCFINTIGFDKKPAQELLRGGLLLLSWENEAQLWDIYQPCLITRFKFKEEAHLDLHPLGNKIIITTDDIMLWNRYEKSTNKQLLFKQLLINWFLLKKQLNIFDSVDSLLNAIAELFANKVKKNGADQELQALKKDLIETWRSFPECMQNVMWRTLQQKMKWNRKYLLQVCKKKIRKRSKK